MSWGDLGEGASRLERLALLTVILALAFALGFAVWATREVVVTGNETSSEYVIDSPIEVTNRLPGIEGPAEYLGVPWHTKTYRCLSIEEPVVISWTTTWINQAGNLVQSGVGGSTTNDEDSSGGAGCEGSTEQPLVSDLTPPDTLVPGIWRFQSDLTVKDLEGTFLTDTVTVSDWVQVLAPEDE